MYATRSTECGFSGHLSLPAPTQIAFSRGNPADNKTFLRAQCCGYILVVVLAAFGGTKVTSCFKANGTLYIRTLLPPANAPLRCGSTSLGYLPSSQQRPPVSSTQAESAHNKASVRGIHMDHGSNQPTMEIEWPDGSVDTAVDPDELVVVFHKLVSLSTSRRHSILYAIFYCLSGLFGSASHHKTAARRTHSLLDDISHLSNAQARK